MSRVPSWLAAGCCFGALFATGASTHGLSAALEAPPQLEGLNAHDEVAGASLLGEFRTSFASWLWVRTDLYLHNGVEMRPLTEAEKLRGSKGTASEDNKDKALHDDADITTSIPSKDRDFRGVFGDIERCTATYTDMSVHHHNDPGDSLPLFRLMTWSDPTFIPAWTTAAAILARGKSAAGPRKAIELLDEGLRENPSSIAILAEKGRIQANKLGLVEPAIASFEASRRLKEHAAGEDELEGLRETYRWLALLYRDYRSLGASVEVAREGKQRFPDDPMLVRLSGGR
ncbi:MAG: hypothetical protein HONBIEJF_02240 [Fimbriimonadaceae bacterium]|nr:hypothetical protein [Fimbriimonadaceae bacterium]